MSPVLQKGSEMNDKVALVTGGSRGIGRACCLSLAERGVTVVACARDESALEEVSAEAKKRELRGTIAPQPLDVCDRAQIDSVVESVIERHEKLDILVNNAGITRDGLLMSMEDDDFDTVLTTNLRSAFWLTRAASRSMVRQRWGRIVNMSSVTGVMGNAGQANYAASKAGLIGLTKTTARELGKRKITCNAVAPGFIETDMTDALPDTVKDAFRTLIPLARFGHVEEVAELVTFLASDAGAYITGQVILVDGGMHM
jgi:3-oxoacyl-[acyl-carrier protein] reductase